MFRIGLDATGGVAPLWLIGGQLHREKRAHPAPKSASKG